MSQMRVPLEPPPGIISDDTTFAAEGAWEDSSNIRFVRERPQVIGGWAKYFNSTLTGVCRNVISWTTESAGVNIAFGTHSKLQVYVAGALYDITPAGLSTGSIDSAGSQPGYGTGTYGSGTYSTPNSIYYARTWSLASWGTTLIANPRGGTAYQWSNNTGVVAAAIANAPAQITAVLVTPERQVLAIGCNETAGAAPFNPLCVRGCMLEDLTTWTATPTNTAFEDILEGGGRLVTGKVIGPYVALWSDNALYIGQYKGQPQQMYRWEMVENNCGVVGPNAVTIYRGVAYWIAQDGQFRMWTPGGKPQVIPCPIRRIFLDNCVVSQLAKIVAVPIAQYDEIWFFYPDLRDIVDGSAAENSRYVAFSLSEGADAPVWFRGILSRTAFIDSGVQQYPIGVATAGTVYSHEYGRDADGGDISWNIKCADQYLDQAQRFLQIQGIWPDFEEQDDSATLNVYVRKHPQATAITKGPFTITASRDKYDFRATGRIASIEVSGTNYARFGKPTFSAVVTGSQ